MSSPVLWYATRATGLVAFVLLSGVMVLGAMTSMRVSTPRWPGFAQQALHRRVSLLTVCFVALHVLTSVLDTFVHISVAAVVVPFASSYKPVWVGAGAVAFDLLAAVVVSSVVRHRLSARTWRSVHWLALACWPIALVHALAMGTDQRLPWVLVLTFGCVLAVGTAAALRALNGSRRVEATVDDRVRVAHVRTPAPATRAVR